MSPAPAARAQHLLHVRPAPTANATTDNMDAELASLGLPVETCQDVYRGLARLCGACGHDYPITVVLVDALGDAEMEFFSIAARSCRSTTVYVYGDERLQARLTEACDRGASDIVTSETIRGLMATAVRPIAPAPSVPVDSTPPQVSAFPTSDLRQNGETDATDSNADVSAASVERASLSPPVSDEVADSHDLLDANPDEVETDLETDDDRAGEADGGHPDVRVPWLRYDKTPARTGPQPRGPSSNEHRGGADPRARSILHEPLLTDEELRALLGDEDPTVDEVTRVRPPNAVPEDEGQPS